MSLTSAWEVWDSVLTLLLDQILTWAGRTLHLMLRFVIATDKKALWMKVLRSCRVVVSAAAGRSCSDGEMVHGLVSGLSEL